MAESEDYSPTEEAEESYMWGDPVSIGAEKGSSRNERKRRFSEEQVKSLEQMFESQTKLEPRKKLQLAKELGLHPRQVAIWFQNKRARWKSKQLEREYNTLRADYDALLSSFESLKNEKQVLTKQLKKLAELLDKPMEERGEDQRTNPTISSEENTDVRFMMSSDDEENKYRKLSLKEAAEPLGSSFVQIQPEQHFCFHQPSWPPDQASQWWEFWPMNE